MLERLATSFAEQGPMGLMALVSLGAAARLYLDNRSDRKMRDDQVTALLVERAKDAATVTALLSRIEQHLEKDGGE